MRLTHLKHRYSARDANSTAMRRAEGRNVTKLHTEEQMIVSDAGRAVEVFLCRPHGAPPGPGVVIVHGHQLGDRSGGRATAESSVFQQWHQRIFLVAAVSQPGYGRSTGPAEV